MAELLIRHFRPLAGEAARLPRIDDILMVMLLLVVVVLVVGGGTIIVSI